MSRDSIRLGKLKNLATKKRFIRRFEEWHYGLAEITVEEDGSIIHWYDDDSQSVLRSDGAIEAFILAWNCALDIHAKYEDHSLDHLFNKKIPRKATYVRVVSLDGENEESYELTQQEQEDSLDPEKRKEIFQKYWYEFTSTLAKAQS